MGACYSTHTRRVSCCRYAVIQGPCLDGCMLFYSHKTYFLCIGMQLHKDRV